MFTVRFEEAVERERDRQRKLGYDRRHDLQHTGSDWVLLLAKQVGDLAINAVIDLDLGVLRVQLGAVLDAWVEAEPDL